MIFARCLGVVATTIDVWLLKQSHRKNFPRKLNQQIDSKKLMFYFIKSFLHKLQIFVYQRYTNATVRFLELSFQVIECWTIPILNLPSRFWIHQVKSSHLWHWVDYLTRFFSINCHTQESDWLQRQSLAFLWKINHCIEVCSLSAGQGKNHLECIYNFTILEIPILIIFTSSWLPAASPILFKFHYFFDNRFFSHKYYSKTRFYER